MLTVIATKYNYIDLVFLHEIQFKRERLFGRNRLVVDMILCVISSNGDIQSCQVTITVSCRVTMTVPVGVTMTVSYQVMMTVPVGSR